MDLTQKNKHYSYNLATSEYTFFTKKKFGKDIIFSEEEINNIIRLYSKHSGNLTSVQIGQKLGVSEGIIKHVLRVMKITHDSLSFTNEYISKKPEDEIVLENLDLKKSKIIEKLEKLELNKTKEKAEKWELFEYNFVSAIDSFLQNWVPPKHVPVKSKPQKTGQNEIIFGCSDWHFGLFSDERYMYNQKSWNIEKAMGSVNNYSQQIKEHLRSRKDPYKRVNLAFLGDLIHGLDGFTDKGTKLEAHPIKEEQLEKAYNSVLHFINNILEETNNIRVFSVPGNHSSFGDYFLMKMLEIYFRNDRRISFDITTKRFLTFDIGNSHFLLDHGYSAVTKSRLPAPGSGRENYINNTFLSKIDQIMDINQKKNTLKHLYYLSADQHHMESGELTNVETYMFSTFISGCRYADNSGYKSRPRQSALVIDPQKGVTEFLHFFFDD